MLLYLIIAYEKQIPKLKKPDKSQKQKPRSIFPQHTKEKFDYLNYSMRVSKIEKPA